MRRNVVIGNWKMNGSVASVTTLVKKIIARGFGEKADCFLCPSFVHVKLVSDILNNSSSNIELGAQDLSEQIEGAFTGEVSGEMLSDLGAGLVLVGHSERRQRFDEKNYLVAEKYKAARAVGLIPVLCVGETQIERENGETEKVVGQQLRVIVEECGSELMKGSIVAYEPIWAIGTGLTATPEQAQAVHGFLRETLSECSSALA
jgi:triosephosphate isomerase